MDFTYISRCLNSVPSPSVFSSLSLRGFAKQSSPRSVFVPWFAAVADSLAKTEIPRLSLRGPAKQSSPLFPSLSPVRLCEALRSNPAPCSRPDPWIAAVEDSLAKTKGDWFAAVADSLAKTEIPRPSLRGFAKQSSPLFPFLSPGLPRSQTPSQRRGETGLLRSKTPSQRQSLIFISSLPIPGISARSGALRWHA